MDMDLLNDLPLRDSLKSLEPYAPLEGSYPIRLDANESYFSLPEKIAKDFSEQVSQLNLNRYPDPYAVEVSKGFADFYGINTDLVTASNGSDEWISIICSGLLQHGDTLLTLAPDFSMYRFYGQLYGLKVECLSKDSDLNISAEAIAEACRKTKCNAVIFSNPCNPTSLGIGKKELLVLLKSVKCLVVVDEAYMDFWSEEESLLQEAENFPNLLILRTCSKAIGLAGARLGFAVGNRALTQVLRAIKSPYNTNSLSQLLGTVVFSHPECLKTCIEEIKTARNNFYKTLQEYVQNTGYGKVYAPLTNFVYWELEGNLAQEISDFTADSGIALRKMGSALRITAGSASEQETLMKVLQNFYKVKKGES